jgi:hypothetical protein
MKITALFICFMTIAATVFAAQSKPNFGLPAVAVIIETQSLKSGGYPDRMLILWMQNPSKNPSGATEDPEYFYTCPDQTRGSYYSGIISVSLLNAKTNAIINTIEIKQEDESYIPYSIRKGYYYEVEGKPDKAGESKPRIMSLKDYNGDGKALEFAVFDKMACMGLDTALIGYSEKQDKVIQYPIHLIIEGDDKKKTEKILYSCDYLFSKKPESPGYWKYEIDYRGRGGTLDKYEIRYNLQKESFEGKCISTEKE